MVLVFVLRTEGVVAACRVYPPGAVRCPLEHCLLPSLSERRRRSSCPEPELRDAAAILGVHVVLARNDSDTVSEWARNV